MRITFVLPFSGRRPGGGIKVIYEYANHLVELGHHVTVIHPAGLHLGVDKSDQSLINLAKFFLLGATKKYLPTQWFTLDERVCVRWVPCLTAFFLPDADVVVATAWGTAEWVSRYPANKGKKYYLIQGFEDWAGNKERVINTWRLPLKKIVISKWLESIAFSLDQPARYIPNGLDFLKFGVDILPEKRDPFRLLMLYHQLELKGTKEGLKALARVRGQFPGIKVTLFGVSAPVKGELPGWVAFEQMPSQQRIRQLYNEAAIFISPSWSEGWGLPPAEAMQCGCATVITDVHEYAVDGKTALLSAPKDIAAMSDNISRLLQDNSYRIKLAYAAKTAIAQYTWPRSTASLVSYFQEPA
jgi:glycosyltransferase involved in cell wall biosynthesis